MAKNKFDIVIFDEAQFIKNHLAARNKAAQQLQARCSLCLTGTPLENHIGEYVSLLNLVLPGFYPYPQTATASMTESQLAVLIRRSKPFVLRRLKKDVQLELKTKTEEHVVLEMSPKQRNYYETFYLTAKQVLKEAKTAAHSYQKVLTAIMRLRQICITPQLIEDDFTEVTPKFSWIQTKFAELQEKGHSVLVFSQFITSLDLIETMCKQQKFMYYRLDGKTTQVKRKKMIQAFQTNKEPAIFLISLKAGGVGLNLTKASYVFHVDPWWNPAVENQATDRAHRIGQTQPVFSYKLIMHDSIEEKIQAIKTSKAALFTKLFDTSSLVQRKSPLNKEDIESLFE